MKTALVEFFGFILICVIGSVVCGFLYMLYNCCASYVVGLGVEVFSLKHFVDGILICFPGLLLFVPMFLMLSLVRHSSQNKVFGMITVALLSIVTWIFVVPLCAKGALQRNALFQKAPPELSSGYFRNFNGKIRYFTELENGLASGIEFESDFNKSSQSGVRFFDDERIETSRDKYGFADPIVGENLKPYTITFMFFGGMFSLVCSAFSASSLGVVAWLCFSSIMMAVIAVGCLLSISSWRLVNALSVVFSTLAILALNYLCTGFYFDSFLYRLDELGGFFVFIKNHFQVAMNVCIIILLSLIGVISFICTKKRKWRSAR